MRHIENYGFYVANNKLFVIQYEDKNRLKVLKHLSLKIDDLIMMVDGKEPNLIFHIHKDDSSYKATLKLDNIEFAKELLSNISDVIADYHNDLKIR